MADQKRKYETDIQNLKAQIAKIVSDSKLKAADVYLKDDRERDKMDMDFAVDVAKVGLEDAKIKATEAKVAADRQNGSGSIM
jgi:hypothetical protein